MAPVVAVVKAVVAVVKIIAATKIGSALLYAAGSAIISRLIAKRALSKATSGGDGGGRVQLPPASDNKLPVVYGTAFISGVITDAKISTDNKTMWYCVSLAEHTDTTVGANYNFGTIYYGGKIANMSGVTVSSLTTNTTPPQTDTRVNGKIKIYLYANGSNSTSIKNNFTDAVTVMSDVRIPANERWNSTLYTANGQSVQMANTAFAIVVVDYNVDAGTTGLDSFQIELQNNVTKPGTAILDYLQNERYGCDIPLSRIDTDSLTALNTYSDETIEYVQVGGGTTTQPRYRINGPIDTANDCLFNLQLLVDSCDSWLQYSERLGKWRVIMNKPYTGSLNSLFSVDSTNLIGGIDINPIDLNETYNEVEVAYPNENIKDQTDYQTVTLTDPTTAWYDPTLISPNEATNRLNIQLPLVNEAVQAKYLAVRRLLQSREDLTISFNLDYSGIQLEAGDVIRVTHNVYGWTDKLFRVSSVSETITEDNSLIASIVAFEYNGTIYNDNAIQDFVPAFNTGLIDPNVISPPGQPVAENNSDTAGTISSFKITSAVPEQGTVLYMDFNYGYNSNVQTHQLYRTVQGAGGVPFVNSGNIATSTNLNLVSVDINDLPANSYYFSVTARNDFAGQVSIASSLFVWTGANFTPVSNIVLGNVFSSGNIVTSTGSVANLTVGANVFVTSDPNTGVLASNTFVQSINTTNPANFVISQTPIVALANANILLIQGGINGNTIRPNTLPGNTIIPNTANGNIIKPGTANGNIIITGTLNGNVIITGTLSGNVIISGTVPGNVLIPGTVSGNVLIGGTVTNVQIANDTIISNNIRANAITANKISANAITVGKIDANAVTANTIAANSITAGKIAANAVTANTIAANSITSNTIQANAITAGKIAANAVTANTIAANSITSNTIQANAIIAGKIAANAVTANTVAANAISANSIQANAITAGKIAANAVTANTVAANAITANNIQANAITAGKIAANAVTANTVAANAITANNIAANSITSNKIAANAITADKIGANAVTANSIQAGSVTANKIAANAITAGKIDANAVFANNIVAFSITTEKLAANSVVAGKIAANAVTAGTIGAGAVTANTIAANAITAGTIAANAITSNTIAANAITAGKIAAGAITAGSLAANSVTANEIAANAIIAGKIAANAVDANALQAFSITGGKLAIGTIEAQNIKANTITFENLAIGAVTQSKSTISDPIVSPIPFTNLVGTWPNNTRCIVPAGGATIVPSTDPESSANTEYTEGSRIQVSYSVKMYVDNGGANNWSDYNLVEVWKSGASSTFDRGFNTLRHSYVNGNLNNSAGRSQTLHAYGYGGQDLYSTDGGNTWAVFAANANAQFTISGAVNYNYNGTAVGNVTRQTVGAYQVANSLIGLYYNEGINFGNTGPSSPLQFNGYFFNTPTSQNLVNYSWNAYEFAPFTGGNGYANATIAEAIAVGQSGAIFYNNNPGGVSGYLETSNTLQSLYSVYSNQPTTNVYTAIAVGQTGTILKSTRNINAVNSWSAKSAYLLDQSNGQSNLSSPLLTDLYSIAGDDTTNVSTSKWVAVGQYGMIQVSVDNGETWTQVLSPTAQDLNAVRYANGKWIACGDNGTLLLNTGNIQLANNWTIIDTSNLNYANGTNFGQLSTANVPRSLNTIDYSYVYNTVNVGGQSVILHFPSGNNIPVIANISSPAETYDLTRMTYFGSWPSVANTSRPPAEQRILNNQIFSGTILDTGYVAGQETTYYLVIGNMAGKQILAGQIFLQVQEIKR